MSIICTLQRWERSILSGMCLFRKTGTLLIQQTFLLLPLYAPVTPCYGKAIQSTASQQHLPRTRHNSHTSCLTSNCNRPEHRPQGRNHTASNTARGSQEKHIPRESGYQLCRSQTPADPKHDWTKNHYLINLMIGTTFYVHVLNHCLLTQSKPKAAISPADGVLVKHPSCLNDQILTALPRPQVLTQKVPLCVLLFPENTLLEKELITFFRMA